MDQLKRKRATKMQMQERINTALTYLRQGIHLYKIKESLMEQYGISFKAARHAVEIAQNMIAGLGDQSNEYERGLVLNRLDHLFGKTTVGPDKNIAQAIQLLKIEAQMLPQKGTVKSTGEFSNGTSESNSPSNALTSQLAEIFGKLGS